MLEISVSLLLVAFATTDATINCSTSLPHVGLSPNYNETIAHAIHSMTVEGLKLFNVHASKENFVPTVNQDISQSNLVLDHAPEDPTNHDFATTTMNLIDKILSSLGNSKDGLGPNWSPVERVAHVFHMWDLWFEIKRTQWEEVEKHPPTDDVCTCLVSTDFNGIKVKIFFTYNAHECVKFCAVCALCAFSYL